MPFCVECGEEVQEEWKFCNFCSSKLEVTSGGKTKKKKKKKKKKKSYSFLDSLNEKLESIAQLNRNLSELGVVTNKVSEFESEDYAVQDKAQRRARRWASITSGLQAFSNGLSQAGSSFQPGAKSNSDMGFKPNCVRCGTQLASQFSVCPYCQVTSYGPR
jgi:hypothetical protein